MKVDDQVSYVQIDGLLLNLKSGNELLAVKKALEVAHLETHWEDES